MGSDTGLTQPPKPFDTLKEHEGKMYTGAPIGLVHNWLYPDGKWTEQKITPDKWQFAFTATKQRYRPAPVDSGASLGSQYHWLIFADQTALKTTKDAYVTKMNGLKFKMGHKRPTWRTFSYGYPEQPTYRQSLILLLEGILEALIKEERSQLAPIRNSVTGL